MGDDADRAPSGSDGAAPVVLLDRDGVINEDRAEFIREVDDWHPLPGSLAAIARLHRAGRRVVIVTNQSGIARGLIAPSALEAIHVRLRSEVEAAGGAIAGIFHCPHHPDDGCVCRKPRPGLIEAAARTLGFDPRAASMVGDRRSDVEAARAAGCRAVLVRSGRAELPPAIGTDVEVFDDLASWVEAELAASPLPAGCRLD
ncbi:MAG: D-glycero-beta-D-manno-heptose 1,7-bisphosphate 7-phosphatase [Myxococcota bacterium]